MCAPNGNDDDPRRSQLVRELASRLSVGASSSFTAVARSGPRERARRHAGDLQAAVAEHDVVGVGLEQVRGQVASPASAPRRSRPCTHCPAICSETRASRCPTLGDQLVSDCRCGPASIGTPSMSLTIIENAVS
jgi:hypothetical protein